MGSAKLCFVHREMFTIYRITGDSCKEEVIAERLLRDVSREYINVLRAMRDRLEYCKSAGSLPMVLQ